MIAARELGGALVAAHYVHAARGFAANVVVEEAGARVVELDAARCVRQGCA